MQASPRAILAPCWVPSGSAPAATPAGNPVKVAGIFHAIQCVTSLNVFPGCTSPSWKIKANDMVPAGAPLQSICGEPPGGLAAQVYLSGISPPSLYPETVSFNGAGMPPPPPLFCAHATPAVSAREAAIIVQDLMSIFSYLPVWLTRQMAL